MGFADTHTHSLSLTTAVATTYYYSHIFTYIACMCLRFAVLLPQNKKLGLLRIAYLEEGA